MVVTFHVLMCRSNQSFVGNITINLHAWAGILFFCQPRLSWAQQAVSLPCNEAEKELPADFLSKEDIQHHIPPIFVGPRSCSKGPRSRGMQRMWCIHAWTFGHCEIVKLSLGQIRGKLSNAQHVQDSLGSDIQAWSDVPGESLPGGLSRPF